jgi:hypothetical protein
MDKVQKHNSFKNIELRMLEECMRLREMQGEE